jgi:hypothetical protein
VSERTWEQENEGGEGELDGEGCYLKVLLLQKALVVIRVCKPFNFSNSFGQANLVVGPQRIAAATVRLKPPRNKRAVLKKRV